MGRTTFALSDETMTRFKKVKGQMLLKNGKERSDDEILNNLIDFFEGKDALILIGHFEWHKNWLEFVEEDPQYSDPFGAYLGTAGLLKTKVKVRVCKQ